MTTATATHPSAGVLVPGSERNLGAHGESLRVAWTKYRAYRRTLAELRDLTDKQLLDVGTDRASMKQFARKAIYGK
jgi:uncharacterized protein YjiS (DUF1127 family)